MLLHYYLSLTLLFLLLLVLIDGSESLLPISRQNKEHLIVLSHGIMGNANDLNYLSALLEKRGCIVLKSNSNSFLNSLNGIRNGAENLVQEIAQIQKDNQQLTKISFVGNSLGGLFARYCIKLLYQSSNSGSNSPRIAGLEPNIFMTIATPHLGVVDYTFLDEYNIPVPKQLKKLVSIAMRSSGKDVFLNDNDSEANSLLYQMATTEEFLLPLKAFKSRRLYANIFRDFVVPLGTAAFLSPEDVDRIRNQSTGKFGIVQSITAPILDTCTGITNSDPTNYLEDMRKGLDSCGWEKILVNFAGIIPIAHNKICAMTKYTEAIDALLGYQEGRFVMEGAADYLSPQ